MATDQSIVIALLPEIISSTFLTKQLVALLPEIILGAFVLIVMLAVAFYRHHGLTLGLTLLGLALTLLSLPFAMSVAPQQVTPLLVIDGYALFYAGLVVAAAFATALLMFAYFRGRSGRAEELYILLLLASLGAMNLAASSDLASLFLSLELLSVALFAMIAYRVTQLRPLEAGIKYLFMAGVSSAFLLFGIALLYARTGTLTFTILASRLSALDLGAEPTVLAGLVMIVVGLGFKISVIPFHMWTPDVYQGAPAPVSGFLASVSKSAAIAVLLRTFITAGSIHVGPLFLVLNLIAIASMVAGNLLALLQDDVKRILAYSSIAHLGYIFVAFLIGGHFAVEAVTFYMATYVIMILGAFGVVSVVSRPTDGAEEQTRLNDYAGLFWRRPWLATAFTLALLSLAGIPLTIGFIGKFYLFTAGVRDALWPALAALIVGSAIGLFYYLRVIAAMARRPGEEAEPITTHAGLAGACALLVITIVLVGLGVYPAVLIDLIRVSAGHIASLS